MASLLGDELRRIREPISIEAMAQRLNVNKNTLGGYERGERLPDVDFLALFAAVTGCSFGRLLDLRLASSGLEEARRLSRVGLEDLQIRPDLMKETRHWPDYPWEVDRELLRNCIVAVEELLGELRETRSVDEKAEAIALTYQQEIERKRRGEPPLSGAEVVRLVVGGRR